MHMRSVLSLSCCLALVACQSSPKVDPVDRFLAHADLAPESFALLRASNVVDAMVVPERLSPKTDALFSAIEAAMELHLDKPEARRRACL